MEDEKTKATGYTGASGGRTLRARSRSRPVPTGNAWNVRNAEDQDGKYPIGLLLFNYQAKETDRNKKSIFLGLLKAELGAVRRLIGNSRTIVPDEALETTETSFRSHEIRVSLGLAGFASK